ncbi:MAG: GIY-YIG nuclease family protein [Candidatus Sabulitectum sp.]|nr:GIY-YIG nuclease family protein [Candidatus Sabulitectum sp.]
MQTDPVSASSGNRSGHFLFVDVQAAGSPGKGILLEVAWKEAGLDVHSFLVRNTGSEGIPSRVKQITGISDEDVNSTGALQLEELRKLFPAAAGLGGEGTPLTLIAHYAPFEKRWLDWLTGMDLDIVCTRELAREKVPQLLSGTLRAVAGAAGYSLGEKRRALDHVLATEAVFLALETGFSKISVAREERLSIPSCPGIYRFFDPDDNLLYVGKAKNLRKRVNSHFTGKQKDRHGELISRTGRVTYEKTDTAFHAAVLESRLIYKFSPQYNRMGRAREEKFLYMSGEMDRVTAQPLDSSYFGPFSSGSLIEEFARLVSFIKSRTNNPTFVENPGLIMDKSVVLKAFAQWQKNLRDCSVFHYGLKLHTERKRREKRGLEEKAELADVEQVKLYLDGLVEAGTLQCRKSAVYRLLQGCEIRWESASCGRDVHKFVENSLNGHWSQSKLQTIKVILAELRRVYLSERAPEITTRFGTVIKGEALGNLLSVV